MKRPLFTPSHAHLHSYRPRAWMALQVADQRMMPGEAPEGSHLWALLIVNGGPELQDLVLEILAEDGEPEEAEPERTGRRLAFGTGI